MASEEVQPFVISDTELACDIIVITAELTVFIYYIMTTKKFFRMLNFGRRADTVDSLSFSESESSQKSGTGLQKDPLTLVMILLILLSLATRLFVELPIDIVKYVEGSQTSTVKKIEQIALQYLFHIPQRAAVLFNVARWTLLYLSLRFNNDSNYFKYRRLVFYILGGLIVSLFVSGSLYVLSPQEQVALYGGLWARGVIMALPLPCYLVLYIGIRRHYASVVAANKHLMSEQDLLCVALALRATGWFFLAISQYHVIRLAYSI